MTNMTVSVELDAEFEAAWFVPINIEKLTIYDLWFQIECSGRKNDPDAWVPISSIVTLRDYDVVIKEGFIQTMSNKLKGTILSKVTEIAEIVTPTFAKAIVQELQATIMNYSAAEIIVFEVSPYPVHAAELPYFVAETEEMFVLVGGLDEP